VYGFANAHENPRLGQTDLQLPILSFGASSLGAEFRSVTLDEVLGSVRVALECGLNFIDTSPFYGRGMSEVLLGVALKGVPRESYTLCTKLGRYDLPHFDFSARRVAESVDVSLHRLGTDHLDIVLCHDIEFVPMQQIVDETIPALRRAQQAGKVRYLGFSGYPQKIFRFHLRSGGGGLRAELQPIHAAKYALRRRDGAVSQGEGRGRDECGAVQRAAADQCAAAGLAEGAGEVKAAARAAAALCASRGSDIAKLALQFSLANEDITTTVAGSANPKNIRQWAEWAAEPLDMELLAEMQAIFAPVKNSGTRKGCRRHN